MLDVGCYHKTFLTGVFFLFLLLLPGCISLPPLPAANFSEPGWTVRQGQAVWRQKRGAPDIAGEILVATNRSGDAFVQLTKNPFPLIIARTAGDAWQIEAPAENRRFARHGTPPARVKLWFLLPKALAGSTLPEPWAWQNSANHWQLENRSTGESLEGYLNQ